MFLYFINCSRKHGCISKRALERSLSTNLAPEKRLVSTSLPTTFAKLISIPFRYQDTITFVTWKMAFHTTSSLLIQLCSLRRNNNVFTSVICTPFHLVSRYSNSRLLLLLRILHMTGLSNGTGYIQPTQQTRKAFYITPFRQKNPALRENYASELHQPKMLRLLKVGRTSCYRMVGYGRVHFILFQNIIFLCMKNWGKIDIFRTTCTWLWRLCPQKNGIFDGFTFYIQQKTHLSSTSVGLWLWPALPSKDWGAYNSSYIIVRFILNPPTQVHNRSSSLDTRILIILMDL